METYRDARLLVDLCHQVVILDDRTVTLTPTEYCVLALLVQHAGAVLPRASILRRIWGEQPEMRTRRLDMHIGGLRKKLGPYADQCIATVAGIGYSFRPFSHYGAQKPVTLAD